mmetsp:Transcript_61616/g.201104  ORF Transcript_61616/g.201104 Transcript_61616/m.201104 type:complete len:297 (-) Transcript_61616:49-939(-)
MVAAHEKADAQETLVALRAILASRRAAGGLAGVVRRAVEETVPPPAGWKRVSFIRHGEGYHNVAQREWKEAGKPGEPYTTDTDPEYRYLDPELTARGTDQARALQDRATALSDVEVIIVSPMRRATQTALIGFERAVAKGVPVLAHELCHETGGKHTCDKRKSVTDLKAEFPQVDYSQGVESEEDPYWDAEVRETRESLAERGAKFVCWLLARPERHIVVAAHSAMLMTLFNAAVEVEQPEGEDAVDLLSWFDTGEMRTTLVAPLGTSEVAKRPPADGAPAEGTPAKKRPVAAVVV